MSESTLHHAIRHLLVGLQKVEGSDDVALLARFAAWRDEAAFELLVFRHGPMVRGLCRRLLRHEHDADDAFQATFLALARKAGSVRGAVGGWLYRVACHAALKARARAAKRPTKALVDDVASTDEAPEWRELRGVLDEEVLALPERFRLPVVLCYLQGKSNTEAAAVLGCPRGTVDSRLSEARRRLRGRLTRRGVAPAVVGVALEHVLVPSAELSAAVVRPLVRAALAFVSHHPATVAAVPASAAALAQGVLHIMFVNKLKWAACLMLVLTTLGTGGLATFRATAEEDPPKPAAKAPPAKAEKPADAPKVAKVTTARELRGQLAKPVSVTHQIENLPLREALDFFSDKYAVAFRIDAAAFQRLCPTCQPHTVNEQPVIIEQANGLPLKDVLAGVLAQVRLDQDEARHLRFTFVARNNFIALVPAYLTPYGNDADMAPFLNPDVIVEQLLGDWVSIDVQDKPLAEVFRDLADQTGANIVLDARCREMAKLPVTLTLQQVRLFKALQVLADMAELKPVGLHNVYYITEPKNADRLQSVERPTSEPPAQFVLPGGTGLIGGGGGGVMGIPPKQ